MMKTSLSGLMVLYCLLLSACDSQAPYQAAAVARIETLEAHPTLRPVLELLSGLINDATMQRLNFEVDGNKRPIVAVVQEFLLSRGLTEIQEPNQVN